MLNKGLQFIIFPLLVVILALGTASAQDKALPTRKVNKQVNKQAKSTQKRTLKNKKISKEIKQQKLQNQGAKKKTGAKGVVLDREVFANKRNENKRNDVKSAVSKGNLKVRNATNRIATAKKKLEQQKQQGKINDTAYNNKMALIKKAEAKLLELKQSIEKGAALTK